MSRAIFVSDIHISTKTDGKAALLARLFDVCLHKGVTHVFLVGDIFDLWIADREYFTAEYETLISKIRELVRSGIEVHYFEGNHDLDLRPFWQHKVGVNVHSEAAFVNLDGLRLRVEHGDEMDPDDRGYLFLRWLLRTPIIIFLGRFLPNSFVAWLGRRMSLASRDYTSQIKTVSDVEVHAVMRTHAERVYKEGPPFDILISGHVHVSEDIRAEGGYRIVNLGTWLKEPLVFDIQNKDSAHLVPLDAFLNQ